MQPHADESEPPAQRLGRGGLSFGGYVRAAFAAGLVLLLGLLAWRLSFVLMLAFGAMVVAAVLDELAGLAERWTPLAGGWAKGVTWLLLAVIIVLFFWLAGAQTISQFSDLARRLPGMLDQFGAMLGLTDLSTSVANRITNLAAEGGFIDYVTAYTSVALNAAFSVLVIVVAGVFLALDPHGYRRGLVSLIPAPYNAGVDRALVEAAQALRLWLVGKVITMLVIGVATGLAMFLLGVPSALALGIIAGVFEFIPFLGPFLGAVPGLLVALPLGWNTLLWVAGAYFAIQQLENNILVPIVQRRTTQLPPVLGLLSIVAFGILFGIPGVIFGTPLIVVVIVLVKELYIREALHRPTHVPGEAKGREAQRKEV